MIANIYLFTHNAAIEQDYHSFVTVSVHLMNLSSIFTLLYCKSVFGFHQLVTNCARYHSIMD